VARREENLRGEDPSVEEKGTLDHGQIGGKSDAEIREGSTLWKGRNTFLQEVLSPGERKQNHPAGAVPLKGAFKKRSERRRGESQSL